MSSKAGETNMEPEAKHKSTPRLRFPEFRDAPEWEEKSLGEVATFYNGRAYKQEELLDQGKYKVLRVGNFFTNDNWYYSDLELDKTKYCDNGDLLYAWSASFGPRIWQGEKVIYHYHIWKVVRKKNINKNFLFIVLDYETEKIKSQSANGLGLLHITKGTIEGWKTSFPRIDEQQKIADCLTSLDELIAAQSQKLDALKAHKKGLLQQLFPAEGETVPQLRFPEFRDAPEWEEKQFEELVEVIDGDRGTNYPKSEEFYSSGYCVFLNAKNVTKNGFAFDEIQFITQEKDDALRNGKLERSDIVLTTRGTVGNFALFSEKIPYENLRINSGMVILRIKSKLIDDTYLYFYGQSETISRTIGRIAFGNAQLQLTVSEIKKFKLYYPELLEQQKIADSLSSLTELIAAQSQKLDALTAHKKGLLQQLFPSPEEVQG